MPRTGPRHPRGRRDLEVGAEEDERAGDAGRGGPRVGRRGAGVDLRFGLSSVLGGSDGRGRRVPARTRTSNGERPRKRRLLISAGVRAALREAKTSSPSVATEGTAIARRPQPGQHHARRDQDGEVRVTSGPDQRWASLSRRLFIVPSVPGPPMPRSPSRRRGARTVVEAFEPHGGDRLDGLGFQFAVP